jgi:hypothetical protein
MSKSIRTIRKGDAMNSHLAVAVTVLALAGCSTMPTPEKHAQPSTPPQDIASAPVVRAPVAEIPLPVPAPDQDKPASAPPMPVVVPPRTLYVCVTDMQGVRQQTAIEFAPKVGTLCRKHPEMSACKYERELCRRGAGRVFAASGVEITPLTELEYDKRVLRVVLRAD